VACPRCEQLERQLGGEPLSHVDCPVTNLIGSYEEKLEVMLMASRRDVRDRKLTAQQEYDSQRMKDARQLARDIRSGK
jgi:hypothetical protein